MKVNLEKHIPNPGAKAKAVEPFSLRSLLPWAGIIVFLGFFFFLPMGRILWVGLNPGALASLDVGDGKLVLDTLGFTFLQAFLSMLLTLALGLPAAILFGRFSFRGKAALRLLTAIPFMLPTVVVAAGFTALLGPRGWINLALMQGLNLQQPPIHLTGTLGVILAAHVFYNATIVIRMVGNAISRIDRRLEQAARTLGAGSVKVFTRVTLPLLMPSILGACMLVFIFDFTSFGVILLLGGPGFSTLELEIYRQATALFNLPLAGWLSLIQLACTLAFSFLYSHLNRRLTVTSTPVSGESVPRLFSTIGERIVGWLLIAFLATFYTLPLLSLPTRSLTRLEANLGDRGRVDAGFTLEYYRALSENPTQSIFHVPPLQAAANSLLYAGTTVGLSLLLGFPAAAALVHPNRLGRIMDPFLMLPLGASAVTLGLGFIITFNRLAPGLVRSPLLVPLAHTLIALPFVVRSLQPALASIPERLRQAAASLGASPMKVWLAVDWPIVARATISAAVFAFTVSLGEFGAASLVVRPESPTLPIAIARFLSQPGAMNYGQAMAMASLLMLLSGAGILTIERLRLPGTTDF